MKDKLIKAVIKNKEKLSYINIGKDNKYEGWTSNFNIKLPNNEKMKLDLNEEYDLFLLFVLASSWSKTGPWENAAFFTTYLKLNNKDKIDLWLNNDFINKEIEKREENSKLIVEQCSGLIPRKKVSFRKDYYSSVSIIANNWKSIKNSLLKSNENNDFNIFIDYISKLEGLGSGKNKMRIKIPLILRELRCQSVFSSIPGELCCVPDERVKVTSKELGITIPNVTSINSLLKASKVIYDNFGDLYDIPLFAYEDIKDDIV